LRKYNVEPEPENDPQEQSFFNINPVSNYSNFIENRKIENNISFSKNAEEENEESIQDISNLQDLDLDYEEFAKREKQMSKSVYEPSHDFG
jgi:hypothetical protein